MARDLHRKPFNEETLVKLELFRSYITAWLAVFVKSQRVTKKKIRIFDLFCGPGTDCSGQKGSPVLILETLQGLSSSIRNGGYSVEVFFNDASPDKITELNETLAERKLLTGPYTLHFSSKDFLVVFEEIQPKMLDSANLLLLDQHGVRFFTADIFEKIRTFAMTDTLVFMAASYVRRFKDEPGISQYVDVKEIFSKEIPNHQVHRALVDYYKSLVPPSQKYFLAPFSLRSGSNIYGVIFGSGNHKGLQKFLETAWSIDPLRGEADYDIDGEGIRVDQQELFATTGRPKKTQIFEKHFETEILEGHLPDTGAVYDFVHQQGFLMKHASSVLRRLKKDGQIDGNLTAIGYSSLAEPESIRVIQK